MNSLDSRLDSRLIVPEHIKALVASGESETLELKRSTGERREAAKSVCAMLNNRGGRVIIGVQPDGTIIGQQIGENTIEQLSQDLRNIDPAITPTIDRQDIGDGRELLIIGVETGKEKPYTYRGQAYRRVGNTDQTLSQREYREMLSNLIQSERKWESEFAPDWTIDDLDHEEIARTVREGIRIGRISPLVTDDPEDMLRGLGLMRGNQLLRAAVVLFKRSRSIDPDYPQCMLRLAKFRGIDRTEFLDNRQFHGNAFYLLERALQFLLESLPIAGRIVPGKLERVDEPLYPPEALREALANAFCHRDYAIFGGSIAVGIYEDRLEITSPGTLHFGLTAQSLFETPESRLWNPLIAGAFYRRGIIETWGLGISKIVELTTQAGLPTPEIEEIHGSVIVRFRPSRYIPTQRARHDLTERQRTILSILSDAPNGLSMSEISIQLTDSLTPRQIRSDLNTLRSVDLVILEGRGRSARWMLSK